MKYLATISLILIALSCSKTEPESLISPLENSFIFEARTSLVPEKESPYFVEMDDVYKYVNFKILESQGKGKSLELMSIDPIRSESGKISMYIIRYNDGWDVISSDKRSPMILASAESGEFEYSETNPHQFYFDMVAEDLQNFVAYEDKQFILTKSLSEDCNENVEYWDAITASEDFIQPYLLPRDTLEMIPPGHWELISVNSERETYDDINHLIPYAWGQKHPYNTYCPLSTLYSGEHVPAGCVAVAGAQTLAYLQDFFDIEIEMPSTITGVGFLGNNSVQYTDFTTALWQTINSPISQIAEDAAAKIISYIGSLVEMEYGNNASGASNTTLRNNVFSYYGINSNYISTTNGTIYSEIIKENLLNNLPIIVSAAKFADGTGGHSFIIDGYKGYRTKYTYIYEWFYDEPFNIPLPKDPEKIEIEYSSPVIEQVRMNWGYANEYYNNDNLYTLTGDWTVHMNGVNSSYNYWRELFYGFSKMQ